MDISKDARSKRLEVARKLFAVPVKPDPPKICPNCGQKFANSANLNRHATASWCARNKNRGPSIPFEIKQIRRLIEIGALDPLRPELGRVPRNTLADRAFSHFAAKRAQRNEVLPGGAASPQSSKRGSS